MMYRGSHWRVAGFVRFIAELAGAAQVCGGVCAGVGGRRARTMGCDVDEFCDCCELLFEVVERSTASLNAFTCFGETVPGFLGGGAAFVSVEPGMLMSCYLSALRIVPVCSCKRLPGERM